MREKWRSALDRLGFQALPNLLITQQRTLRISSTEMVVLLHFNRSWWKREEAPYPSPGRIATMMGVHRRTVERCLANLEKKGLVERMGPMKTDKGRTVWPVSLCPLANRLESLVPTGLEQREGSLTTEEARNATLPAQLEPEAHE